MFQMLYAAIVQLMAQTNVNHEQFYLIIPSSTMDTKITCSELFFDPSRMIVEAFALSFVVCR